jgi:hypothetical protein
MAGLILIGDSGFQVKLIFQLKLIFRLSPNGEYQTSKNDNDAN